MIHFKVTGSGPNLVIIHGLFGMLDNWQSIAKILSEHFTVYTIDAPNHGKSSHTDAFNYEAMSKMLLDFFHEQDLLESHIIGHSMGGKIAMKFAQNYPEYISKLIIADIGPKDYPIHHDIIIDALQSVDFKKIQNRKQITQKLSEFIQEQDVIQFLTKSVYWQSKDQLGFRFNLDVIAQQISNVGEEIFDRAFEKPTLFIHGSNSNYILEQDKPFIQSIFTDVSFKTIKDAGHWLHAEQPGAFIEATKSFLVT